MHMQSLLGVPALEGLVWGWRLSLHLIEAVLWVAVWVVLGGPNRLPSGRLIRQSSLDKPRS